MATENVPGFNCQGILDSSNENGEQEQNMDPHDFCNAERLVISPRKILLIGTMGSGKTTLAEYLARDTGFPYASIDACRIRYSNSTVEGEDSAWDHFLELCSRPAPEILEFSGGGPHVDEVRKNLLSLNNPCVGDLACASAGYLYNPGPAKAEEHSLAFSMGTG